MGNSEYDKAVDAEILADVRIDAKMENLASFMSTPYGWIFKEEDRNKAMDDIREILNGTKNLETTMYKMTAYIDSAYTIVFAKAVFNGIPNLDDIKKAIVRHYAECNSYYFDQYMKQAMVRVILRTEEIPFTKHNSKYEASIPFDSGGYCDENATLNFTLTPVSIL